jgi:hypothetical protein
LGGHEIESADTFHFLAKQVNLRTLLYILGRGRTQEFDLMIPKWAHAVYDLGAKATKAQLVDVYKSVAQPKDEDFAKLLSEMERWDYLVGSEQKRIRAVLAFLSSELNALCNKPIKFEDTMRTRKLKGESHAWEIEHIQPKSVPNDLPVHTIGNLVLLAPPDNNDLSNKEPKLKYEHYKKCSLELTSLVSGGSNHNNIIDGKITKLLQTINVNPDGWDLDNWNQDSIDNRKDFYFNFLVHLIKSAG